MPFGQSTGKEVRCHFSIPDVCTLTPSPPPPTHITSNKAVSCEKKVRSLSVSSSLFSSLSVSPSNKQTQKHAIAKGVEKNTLYLSVLFSTFAFFRVVVGSQRHRSSSTKKKRTKNACASILCCPEAATVETLVGGGVSHTRPNLWPRNPRLGGFFPLHHFIIVFCFFCFFFVFDSQPHDFSRLFLSVADAGAHSAGD